jgi:transcriptional regulator with XRE-family HTH domain
MSICLTSWLFRVYNYEAILDLQEVRGGIIFRRSIEKEGDMSQGCAFHRARMAKGLSLADVAKAVGVTRAAASNWDRGVSYPRREKALQLAAIFGIDADDLQREPVSHHVADAGSAENVTDIFADARRRLAKVLGVPTNRVKLTMSIDG